MGVSIPTKARSGFIRSAGSSRSSAEIGSSFPRNLQGLNLQEATTLPSQVSSNRVVIPLNYKLDKLLGDTVPKHSIHPSKADNIHPSKVDNIYHSKADNIYHSKTDNIYHSKTDNIQHSKADSTYPNRADSINLSSNNKATQQYGGPPPQAGREQSEAYKRLLQATIQQKSLQNMIPSSHPNLERYAQRAPSQIDQLCARWHIPREIGQDLAKLALFDIVLYIDNSGSMKFDDSRIAGLKQIITSVVYAATLFDDDGISIRFMNDWPSNPAIDGFDMRRLDRIQNEQTVEQIISKTLFSGLTPLGSELRNKVIDPLVLSPARAGQLQKPVLVITITDGFPEGEQPNTIFETIRYASNELSRMPQYGPGAISFQFAQVGNDQQATDFLAKLDSDPYVGQLVDCTSTRTNLHPGHLQAKLMVRRSRRRMELQMYMPSSPISLPRETTASLPSEITVRYHRNKAMGLKLPGIEDTDNHPSQVMDKLLNRTGVNSPLRRGTASTNNRTTADLRLLLDTE
ncbi:MAG: hypothetical protein Q9173_000467 [Seirophora scorigena]